MINTRGLVLTVQIIGIGQTLNELELDLKPQALLFLCFGMNCKRFKEIIFNFQLKLFHWWPLVLSIEANVWLVTSQLENWGSAPADDQQVNYYLRKSFTYSLWNSEFFHSLLMQPRPRLLTKCGNHKWKLTYFSLCLWTFSRSKLCGGMVNTVHGNQVQLDVVVLVCV